jgi:hypothetical protein
MGQRYFQFWTARPFTRAEVFCVVRDQDCSRCVGMGCNHRIHGVERSSGADSCEDIYCRFIPWESANSVEKALYLGSEANGAGQTMHAQAEFGTGDGRDTNPQGVQAAKIGVYRRGRTLDDKFEMSVSSI